MIFYDDFILHKIDNINYFQGIVNILKCNYKEALVKTNNNSIRIIGKKNIKCEVNEIDRYKRYVAACYLNDLNINQHMVRQGWAIAYRYYSKQFVEDEELAQKYKLGIWKGTFIEPYLFRKNNK